MSKIKAGPIRADRLKSFVDRYEKLGEERDAVSGDMRDILSEAKSAGYDAPTIRWLVKERKVDVADRDERDRLRDTYALALGMAVNLVEVEGMSLRKAAKATGLSKSSIHRALSVPRPSQPAGSETGEITQPPGPDTPVCEGVVANESQAGDALAIFGAGNSAHEGEANGRKSNAGRGASPASNRDGELVIRDGRQSAPPEQHAGSDRGTAGAVRADAEVDLRGQGACVDRAAARIAGGAARAGERDGRPAQPSGRDLLTAGRPALENGNAAPGAAYAACPSSPQTDGVGAPSVTSVPDEGVGDWPTIPARLDRRAVRAP